MRAVSASPAPRVDLNEHTLEQQNCLSVAETGGNVVLSPSGSWREREPIMTVELEGIKFNYDPDLSKTGTFNIRQNEATPVSIPEWPPRQGSDFKSSPAAYSIIGAPKDLTIQASFKATGGLQAPLKVKAVATSADKILGDVALVEIPASGSSGFIKLNLPDARVKCAAIGIHDITWSWQFSTPSVSWTEFQRTNHRIYTVLARPPDPWEATARDATNIHQPWTEVLDLACLWASGVSGDPDSAAKFIAKEFFRQISDVATYTGNASFSFGKFKITEFLQLLADDPGVLQTVNCDDCATAVSTFANIVGCELSQSSMGAGSSFPTHPVLMVGAHQPLTQSFRYHTVAWKGACGVNDEVFDGSLQIDEDHVDPFIAVQPTDIPFGNDTTGYKFFLVNNSPSVHPLPGHLDLGRRRRKFSNTTYLGDAAIREPELIAQLKRDFAFDSWPAVKEDGSNGSKVDFAELLKGAIFSQRSFHTGNHFSDDRFPDVLDALFTRSDSLSDALLAATVYRTKETSDPNLNLLEILGRFESPDLKRPTKPIVGDEAFVNSNGSTVVFRRNRLLAVVRSAGKRQVSVVQDAQELDHLLTEMSGDREISKDPKLIARRSSSMNHLFKGLKTVWTYRFDENDNTLKLVKDGTIILDKIKPDGDIPEGYHVDGQGTAHPIKGRAYKYKGDLYLTFAHDDTPDTFFGRLITPENNDEQIVVTGSLFSETPGLRPPPQDKAMAALGGGSQQEQPIVISKP